MAKEDDWILIGLAIIGGLLAGYVLETRLGILSRIIDLLFGKQPMPVPVSVPTPVPEPAKRPAKLYPNPIYDPYAIYDNDPDAWYYMY